MGVSVKYKDKLYICRNCGLPYQPAKRNQKYCSEKCRNARYLITKEKVATRKPRVCVNCGELFKEKQGNQRYCSAVCQRERYKIRKGYNLDEVSWSNLREFILERDNYHCQDCDKYFMDIGLEVHHIMFLRERGTNDEENLISLCHKCHKKRHGM